MLSMCVQTTLNLVFVCKAGTVPATVNTTDTPYILIESWADSEVTTGTIKYALIGLMD